MQTKVGISDVDVLDVVRINKNQYFWAREVTFSVTWDNRPPAVCVSLQASHSTDTKTGLPLHKKITNISMLSSAAALTLLNVNWEVLYDLWIQPQVIVLKFSLLCVLVGLLVFSWLLHQLTANRST